MQNFLAFRDRPIMPLRRTPRVCVSWGAIISPAVKIAARTCASGDAQMLTGEREKGDFLYGPHLRPSSGHSGARFLLGLGIFWDLRCTEERLLLCLRNPIMTEKLLHLPTSRKVGVHRPKTIPHFCVVGGDTIILNGGNPTQKGLSFYQFKMHCAHRSLRRINERLCLRSSRKLRHKSWASMFA